MLTALDHVLAAAVIQADASGTGTMDAFRGLHLGPDDVARDLGRLPCTPAYSVPQDNLAATLAGTSPLARLPDLYQLSTFERACLLLAIAPEIDLRYERIFAYLQDDVTRKRPTVSLALDLFSADAEARWEHARRLAPDGPLWRDRLLDASSAGSAARPSLPLVLDGQVLRFLLGEAGVEPGLAPWCALRAPAHVVLPSFTSGVDMPALARLAQRAAAAGTPMVLHLVGPHGTGKRRATDVLASHVNRAVLAIDLRGALHTGDFDDAVRRALRAAWLHDALPFLHGYDALVDASERQPMRSLAQALSRMPGPTVLAGRRPWQPDGAPALAVVRIEFDTREPAVREAAWVTALSRHGIPLQPEPLAALSTRFLLTHAQIEAAAASARNAHDWQADQAGVAITGGPTASDIARAARAQCGHSLALLARRINPRRTWRDLVLPDESVAILREISARVVHRERVMGDWGFEDRLSLGKGIAALFAGPSGTGKTLAAEVIAADLGLDLFQIDLANVVSKYIGETEKNLDRVFEAAGTANAVLLFDEAEALFGKRSEVRDAHDRYANLEIAYLLQKMDEFDGLAILSTNMRQNIDEAFTRRLAFTVHFPFPEEADRKRIWELIWPDALPRAADIDADLLSRELLLSGGHIKNAALAAAFYAAADGGVVTRAHVLRAANREFQKMGRVASPVEARR